MNQKVTLSKSAEHDKKVFELAIKFLLNEKKVEKAKIDKYADQSDAVIHTIDDVFHRLIVSLQNANMKANVIGGSIGGIQKLLDLLPELKSLESYKSSNELLDTVFADLKPNSHKKVEEHKQDEMSIWNKYAKSVISAGLFLKQFKDIDDFKKWVDFFEHDDRARAALPMLLSNEVYGLGFALACDFLKEIGYLNFGKPDVHIKEIFIELKLSDSRDDYMVLKDIARVANNVQETPYYVDKIFWLIGSGNFYLDGEKIGRNRNEFIEYAKRNLS